MSVDIDIAFIDHTKSHDEALQTIRQELQSLCKRIEPLGLKGTLASTGDSEDVKTIITRGAVSMKVEVNYNFRGTLLPPRDARISELASWSPPSTASTRGISSMCAKCFSGTIPIRRLSIALSATLPATTTRHAEFLQIKISSPSGCLTEVAKVAAK